MFVLVDGNPIFYIGKINGIGYTSEKEKELLIKQLKEDNPDIEIKDEKLEIDEELRTKAMALGELQLTYSRSEFIKLLESHKDDLATEVSKLKASRNTTMVGLLEINNRLRALEGK